MEGFREAFAEAFREGIVKADWKARLVWVPNVIRHNPPESPNVVRSWRVAWDELPECKLKTEAYKTLKAFLEAFGEAFAKAFGEACPHPSPNQEQEQEQEQEEEDLAGAVAPPAAGAPKPKKPRTPSAQERIARALNDKRREVHPELEAWPVESKQFIQVSNVQFADGTELRSAYERHGSALFLRAFELFLADDYWREHGGWPLRGFLSKWREHLDSAKAAAPTAKHEDPIADPTLFGFRDQAEMDAYRSKLVASAPMVKP